MTGLPPEAADLSGIAKVLRRDIVTMVHRAGSGHCGGSLSAVEILALLYWEIMRIRPREPGWEDRDRFILSKGHACPALYAALARRGYLPLECLTTLRRFESPLQGHPSMHFTPGVDMNAGSLGQGLSAGCGMSLGARALGKQLRVYVLLSDGEMDEGLVWEAAMFAAHYRLDNLTAIIDHNGLQLDGTNAEVMGLEPFGDKWKSFGWDVRRCDGHDFDALREALSPSDTSPGAPSVVIARTVKGKGVSFMENRPEWHGKVPDDAQLAAAIRELDAGGQP
jgi:transketolase